MTKNSVPRQDVYTRVTNKIIAGVAQGCVDNLSYRSIGLEADEAETVQGIGLGAFLLCRWMIAWSDQDDPVGQQESEGQLPILEGEGDEPQLYARGPKSSHDSDPIIVEWFRYSIQVIPSLSSSARFSNRYKTRTLSQSSVLSLGSWIGVSVTVLSMRSIVPILPLSLFAPSLVR
jgi:hypothetical protein